MGEKQEILERVLLLMKYDNKKTLSENRGVIVEQYSVKTLIDKIDSNYKSGNKITKEFISLLDSYAQLLSTTSLYDLLKIHEQYFPNDSLTPNLNVLPNGMYFSQGKQSQYGKDMTNPNKKGTLASSILEQEIYKRKLEQYNKRVENNQKSFKPSKPFKLNLPIDKVIYSSYELPAGKLKNVLSPKKTETVNKSTSKNSTQENIPACNQINKNWYILPKVISKQNPPKIGGSRQEYDTNEIIQIKEFTHKKGYKEEQNINKIIIDNIKNYDSFSKAENFKVGETPQWICELVLNYETVKKYNNLNVNSNWCSLIKGDYVLPVKSGGYSQGGKTYGGVLNTKELKDKSGKVLIKDILSYGPGFGNDDLNKQSLEKAVEGETPSFICRNVILYESAPGTPGSLEYYLNNRYIKNAYTSDEVKLAFDSRDKLSMEFLDKIAAGFNYKGSIVGEVYNGKIHKGPQIPKSNKTWDEYGTTFQILGSVLVSMLGPIAGLGVGLSIFLEIVGEAAIGLTSAYFDKNKGDEDAVALDLIYAFLPAFIEGVPSISRFIESGLDIRSYDIFSKKLASQKFKSYNDFLQFQQGLSKSEKIILADIIGNKEFQQQLANFTKDELDNIWKNLPNKTELWKTKFAKQIAPKLGVYLAPMAIKYGLKSALFLSKFYTEIYGTNPGQEVAERFENYLIKLQYNQKDENAQNEILQSLIEHPMEFQKVIANDKKVQATIADVFDENNDYQYIDPKTGKKTPLKEKTKNLVNNIDKWLLENSTPPDTLNQQ
jgi:hypothetical protein